MQPIEILSDKVRINGPKIDGSWTVTFETGEQEQINVAKLLAIPQQTNIKLTVELTDERPADSTS